MQGALGLTKAVIDPVRHPMRLPVGLETLFEGLRRREETVCRPAGEPLVPWEGTARSHSCRSAICPAMRSSTVTQVGRTPQLS